MRGGSAVLWALVLAAAAAAPARAQSCRSGDTSLADERALVAFREEIEAECPCRDDEAPGSPRLIDFRACAHARLRAAVEAGALRSECEAAARDLVAGSTCATSGVPCVAASGGGAGAASCRIQDERSCATRAPRRLARIGGGDGPRVRRPAARPGRHASGEACSEATHCADVLEWGAGTCLDVRADGPWGRGVRFVTLRKPSAVDASVERELELVVWYPAPPGTGPVDEQRRAVVDAPLDPSGGPYPLLLFSHGSCGYAEQSLYLTPFLASHGFIVAAPDHTGNTLFEFPDCQDPTALANAFIERPEDIIFAIDHVLAANQDPSSFLFQAVDPSRIGMSGHSFGGLTTYLVEERDPRIRVAIPLAAAVPGMPQLEVPSLTMIGEIDSAVDNDAIRSAYAASRSPKIFVEIDDAGHYAFSDGCFPGPDCDPPRTRTQREANELVKRWVLPFLQVYLAGDERFAPFLSPENAPPGTPVTAD